jgi:molybdopterin-synthase adenylyltransferase
MNDELSRQSFLGADSDLTFSRCKVGIVGLSGGGSHIVQQLAHLGILNYVAIDPKKIAKKHLHRVVGCTSDDIDHERPKAVIAERVIRSVRPTAGVKSVVDKWQNAQVFLRDCTAIFGCVDSFTDREQLDRFCRRFLIPYIDIGMDVIKFGESHRIVGQVAMSSPGYPCLRCMGIVTEDNLKQEAAQYGAAGPRPQVIWPNGVLASSAVGLFVQLVTPWHESSCPSAYVEYNGNAPTLVTSPRMEYAIAQSCGHFVEINLGDPFFDLQVEPSGEPPLQEKRRS